MATNAKPTITFVAEIASSRKADDDPRTVTRLLDVTDAGGSVRRVLDFADHTAGMEPGDTLRIRAHAVSDRVMVIDDAWALGAQMAS